MIRNTNPLRSAADASLPSLVGRTIVVTGAARGVGRVIAEGMLAERPVIATAGGGASEIVRAGATAWQVAPNDPAALAAAIRDVLANPDRAAKVARAGKQDALARFALGVTLPQTERAVALAAGARA